MAVVVEWEVGCEGQRKWRPLHAIDKVGVIVVFSTHYLRIAASWHKTWKSAPYLSTIHNSLLHLIISHKNIVNLIRLLSREWYTAKKWILYVLSTTALALLLWRFPLTLQSFTHTDDTVQEFVRRVALAQRSRRISHTGVESLGSRWELQIGGKVSVS